MELSRASVLEPPEDPDLASEPSSRRRVPGALLVASELGWRIIVVVAAVAVLAYGLWYVRLVALPAFVALLLSTVLVPPARALRRRGLRPALATSIVFFGGLAMFAALVTTAIPILRGHDPPPALEPAGD